MISFEDSKLHYLNVGTRGRGEPIRFILRDAGVNYQDVLYSFPEWGESKAKIAEMYPAAVLPFIETKDGQYFGATVPLLRLLGKQLGYYPTDPEDDHFIEQTADLASGWVAEYCNLFFLPDQKEYHRTYVMPHHLARIERLYAAYPNGPYALGAKITYADFLVYHILYQEKLLDNLQSLHLNEFVKAFENRPKIKAYLDTLPKQEEDIVIDYYAKKSSA
ncbi:hypothetical protein BDA99DRAFT_540559 [Phascolomyces articulosus]|uniref:Glutathione S-transferase n=1 Tax=Phascolomyces articulosus TaxID=60185 RepID=A0AAD5K4L9_9FUNG|nr:hypothetical protein BDA99DRAFT_540559 [Phascolomyces articulosus]